MSHRSYASAALAAVAVTGNGARCFTIRVPANPLACTYGSSGPRSVPVDGMSRTVSVTSLPFAYDGLITISTRPFGTDVASTRSPEEDGPGVGVTLLEQAESTSAASSTARIAERLVGARAEEDFLQIGEGGAESGDEEDADEEASQAGDEADHYVKGAQPLRSDET